MKIEELHDRLFEVLCVIDDICRKENVRWFLTGGTELGAVRDGDFIPWDDDMDIKVLSEDYPSFKKAMIENLPPYMHLIEPCNIAPAFYDFTIRIIDDRFLLRKDNEDDSFYSNLVNHVGTDVFLFSKVGMYPFSKTIKDLSYKILYGLGMAHRLKIDYKKYKPFQKLQVGILSFIGRGIPAKKICKWWENSVHRYDDKITHYRFTNGILTGERFQYESSYQGIRYFNIRNRQFPVPSGYDSELTRRYGDYMKPVKDEKKYNRHLY